MAIHNPNSSGQGFDPSHISHPFAALVLSFGYVYGHSTPIHALDGTIYTSHTYRHGEHTVSLDDNQTNIWATSTSCGSGRQWMGKGYAELKAHLASKARRYSLKRA